MNNATMQHPRKSNVGSPGFFRGHFGSDDGVRKRLSNDVVLADRLHRRIAFNSETKDAGEISADRNRQFQLLVFDQIAVRNALATAGNDAFFPGELLLGNREALRSKF